MKIPAMVDMSMDDEEKAEFMTPSPPKYPYGLCISLCEKELEKLNLDGSCDVGDMLHMHCLAKVTSVSSRDDDNGSSCRIELQITHIEANPENEDEENAESQSRTSKLYL